MLAVEIFSPTTARIDRYRKRTVYQQEGVDEYWIVDPAARLVERWRPGEAEPDVHLDRLEWQPLPSHPALSLDLPSLLGSNPS